MAEFQTANIRNIALMGHGSDGHPVLALFLSVPKHSVDVNVSPAKTEVRFSDGAKIRGMLVASLRNTLAEHGNKTATTVSIGALDTHIPQIILSHPLNLLHILHQSNKH